MQRGSSALRGRQSPAAPQWLGAEQAPHLERHRPGCDLCRWVCIVTVWHASSPRPYDWILRTRNLSPGHAKTDCQPPTWSGKGFASSRPVITTTVAPPSTGLFVSTDLKLGEESELFKDLKR